MMVKRLDEARFFKKAVIFVFSACFVYWSYLLFASQMTIACDAIGYENLGSMIYKKGWVEYFKTGPNREPLYPLTIAISMRVADIFGVSYQMVQKLLQMMVLFASQLLLLTLMSRLKINNKIKLITILYFGFSPSIVNSAFSLLSEIITYPFVLAIILFGALSWRAIHNSGPKSVAMLSFATSLSFVFATFAKGIFQYIFIFFLIPYLCIAVNSIMRKNKAILLHSVLYITIAVLVFNSFIIPFKLMNKRFNGNFEFTNRYDYLLLENALKRAQPLTKRIFFAHLATIPGGGVCRLFFTEDECRYADFYGADYIFATFSPDTFDIKLRNSQSNDISLAFGLAIKHPLKYFLFMVMEAAKMPFWESTRLAFVNYPPWLERLFNFRLLKDGLRLAVSVLTYFSLFSLIIFVFKKRHNLLNPRLKENEGMIICFFILTIVFTYIGLYSLFSTAARYYLPIAPLFIMCIAYFLNNKIYKGYE